MLKRLKSSAFSTSLKQIAITSLLGCFLLSGIAFAQVLYGSLTGTVTDPGGAAVVGAKVEAINVNTGVVQSTSTNDSGLYRFPTLFQGTYKITIASSGFATQETNNVTVSVNTVARVDGTLKLA